MTHKIWYTYMKYDVYMAEWYSNSINVKQHQTSRSTIYISTVHIYMHHIISCCIHYECKHEKQVFPCTTWTLKSLYNAGHKLKHFWSQIVPGHKLKHFVVTNRAAVTNWSESQIVPSQLVRETISEQIERASISLKNVFGIICQKR